MKKNLFFFLPVLVYSLKISAQDTILIQDFEMTPATPTWNFTGTPS